jgi:hypothetical protein
MELQVASALFCVTRKINILVRLPYLQGLPSEYIIFGTLLLNVIKSAQVLVVRIKN